MRRILLPLAIVAILGGFAAWWFSDVQVLKRRTLALLSTLTLDAGAGKATRHLGAYSLNGILSPQVELETPTIQEANGSFERNELESAYSWLCDQAKETHFKAGKFQSVKVAGKKATVELTLNGLVILPVYRPVDGDFQVVFEWAKGEDGWRLGRARWIQLP